MDCCNYVEPYAGGGHFYQQQHYFCYDNANVPYAGYDVPPITSAIEANSRYNGALPPAYPTDYVYNPKEARLRKAMREQNRELSRRSILQNAIARAGGIGAGPSVSVSVSGGFLDHQHRFACVSTPAVSPLSINSSVESDRLADPWFQSTHRPKPVRSPRMTDWYGDPIERLQAMGTMHQRPLIDKSCKDIMRNRAATAAPSTDCTNFSGNSYSPDFSGVNRERELRRQESIAEYADFADGQKWHPYQNSISLHQHSRPPHSSQMANILHQNVQNTNAHGHGHGTWGQFCHGVLPHVPSMARNVGIRGPRHAVFLQDRMPNRHCGFSEETTRMAYASNKLEMDSVRVPYPPTDHHQIPRLMEPPVDSVMESTAPPRARREEDERNPWESNPVTTGISLDGLVPKSTEEPGVPREREREAARRSTEKFEPRKKNVCKQPLPGFHQAFGSTEIGRFSRSEFFVNMVGESGQNVEVADGDTGDPKGLLPFPNLFPFQPTACGILGTSGSFLGIAEDAEILSSVIPGECCWFTAQPKRGIFRVPDDPSNSSPLLDYTNSSRDREWFCRNTTIMHSSDIEAALRQQRGNLISECGNRRYVIIDTNNINSENNESKTRRDQTHERVLEIRKGNFPMNSDVKNEVVHVAENEL